MDLQNQNVQPSTTITHTRARMHAKIIPAFAWELKLEVHLGGENQFALYPW
jgi:hypothetical protein